MKRLLCILLTIGVLFSSVPQLLIGNVKAEKIKNDSFVADFTSQSEQWEGSRTDFLGYQDTSFGISASGNTAKGSIATKEKYNFSEKFDVEFALFTASKNAGYDLNSPKEDFNIKIGRFNIAVCGFQTSVKLYYDGTEVSGVQELLIEDVQKTCNYHYNVHIEKGNISISSEKLVFTSNFSDFEAVNAAQVSIDINETWHIKTEAFSYLLISASGGELKKEFTADFADKKLWAGSTKLLGYEENKFGADGFDNPIATIISADKYDFGNEFDIEFALNTYRANMGENGTNEDFYLDFGKLRIAICDFQTRIEVYYDGKKVSGESICSNNEYIVTRDYHYTGKLKDGVIELKSELVSYSGIIENFEPINSARVSVTINEDWQIKREAFSSLFVGYREPIIPKTEFTADFSKAEGWSGLTEYIAAGDKADSFGVTKDFKNKKGSIIADDIFDFGEKINMKFSLYTYRSNENKNTVNEDYYISVGDFKIAVCNFQTDIVIYYKENAIEGKVTSKSDIAYPESTGIRDYNYHVTIEKGKLRVESELLVYESEFAEYEAVNGAKISVSLNEDWQIYTVYFKNLTVNVPERVYENGGNFFYTKFEDASLWDNGDMAALIDTQNGHFPIYDKETAYKHSKGSISSVKAYSFGNNYSIRFGIDTVSLNAGYKNATAENLKHTDYKVTVGNITFESKHFQNGIAISQNNVEVASVYNEVNNYDKKYYDYVITVSGMDVTVTQKQENDILLTLSCRLIESPQSESVVSLSVLEDWQIREGYFNYLMIDDAELGIGSAEDYENSVSYDWTDAAFGGDSFFGDFSDKSIWTDELVDYINTDEKYFGSVKDWKNALGKITTAKWYGFGSAAKLRFNLYTYYMNNGMIMEEGTEKLKKADYRVNIGKFTVEIRYFQNAIALYYDGKLLGEATADELNYKTKDYSYLLQIESGNIVLKQMQGANTLLEVKSQFSDYEPLDKVRISLEVLEDWQIRTGYFKSVSVEKIVKYNSLMTFNAAKDISEVLASGESERAWVKSQWALTQKFISPYAAAKWSIDSVVKKLHITGFYDSIPYEPNSIPVMHAENGDYSSEVGIYGGGLLLRANFPDKNKRTTALTFEAPADGTVWLHDPEYGAISVADTINGINTWTLNDSDNEVKSLHLAIYKNDEKVWPTDSEDYLLANVSHPDVTSAIRNVIFPELVFDVKQGDMIYLTVRPEHYIKSSNKNLSTNPTAILLNPQIDYIKINGEMKLNTDRELPEEIVDINIASTITAKSDAIREIVYETSGSKTVIILICSIAAAVALSAVGVVIVIRKVRAKK